MNKTDTSRKLIFVTSEDWAFLTHRLPMANAAVEAGYDVTVATRVGTRAHEIEALGFRVVHIPMDRGGMNPFRELGTIFALMKLFRRVQPDVVQNIALKPILDGSLAALAVPSAKVINTFTGMGSIFIKDRGALKGALAWLFRLIMGRENVHIIYQNDDDRDLLAALRILRPQRAHLIPGSGVDTSHFSALPEPATGPFTVTFVGRMLWDKGIGELVEAARLLKGRGEEIRFLLVGNVDPDNPSSLTAAELEGWQREGLIEWRGHASDIRSVWQESHIAVLPSYREGMPKSMLEAAACGRPLIMTDVPGCRALGRDGENGILVPAGNPIALSSAIDRLSKSPALRRRHGQAARTTIEIGYSASIVAESVGRFYWAILKVGQ